MVFQLPESVPRKRRSFYALSGLAHRVFGRSLPRQICDIAFYGMLRRQFGIMGYFDVLPPEFRDGPRPGSVRDYVNGNGGWRHINRPLLAVANPVSVAILDDKPMFCALASVLGLPVEPCVALWRPGRPSLGARSLRDGGEIAAFLRAATYPLFGKPVDAQSGLGAASIVRYEASTDSLFLLDGSVVPVPDFVAAVLRGFPRGYLFQRRIPQHPEIAALCGNTLSTVRIVTIIPEDGRPRIAYASWKIAAPDAMADNSWRPGSISAAVDTRSGRVTRAQSGLGIAGTLVESCPRGAPLIGRAVPLWEEAKATALAAHAAFPDVRIVGWDVAISPDGPVVLEGNVRPNHLAYQISSGRGALASDCARLARSVRRARLSRIPARALDRLRRRLGLMLHRMAAVWVAFGPSALRR